MLKRIKSEIGEHMTHLGWACWGTACECRHGNLYAPLARAVCRWEERMVRHMTRAEYEAYFDRPSWWFNVTSWLVNTGTKWTFPEGNKEEG